MNSAALFAALFFSYALMLAAYFFPHKRSFHIPAMASVVLFDMAMPFYLYTHRDWWKRLIEQEDIFSFLVWMHIGLLIGMYVLEGLQISSAGKILKGANELRAEHRSQGKVLLLVRGFVILTGLFLAE